MSDRARYGDYPGKGRQGRPTATDRDGRIPVLLFCLHVNTDERESPVWETTVDQNSSNVARRQRREGLAAANGGVKFLHPSRRGPNAFANLSDEERDDLRAANAGARKAFGLAVKCETCEHDERIPGRALHDVVNTIFHANLSDADRTALWRLGVRVPDGADIVRIPLQQLVDIRRITSPFMDAQRRRSTSQFPDPKLRGSTSPFM